MPKFDPITGRQIVSEGTISPEGVIHAPFIPSDTEKITPTAISPAVPLDVSVPSIQPPTTSAAIVAGAEQTVQDLAKRAEITKQAELAVPPETELSKQIKALTTQATGLITETGGRGAEQLRREQELGVPGLSTQLADLNSQILTKLAEHKAIQAKYAQAITGIEAKPISMARAAGQQTQLERQQMAELNRNASEIGLLQAQAQGAQGQLQAAQASANRAVDLKYQDIQDQLNIKSKQLDLLYPQLEKEEKRWADALKERYNRERQDLENEKTEEKRLTNSNLDAMNKYPSAGINVKDTDEVRQNKVLQSAEYKAAVVKQEVTTADITEYNFAKSQGYTGTFQQWQKRKGKITGEPIPIEKPLTINQIDQFRRSYGWTPPYGFTEGQLLQYMKDNPTATPEELEVGAKNAIAGITAPTITPITDKNTIEGIKERLRIAKNAEYSNEEIKETIRDSYTDKELFTLAKSAGYAKWYTGKEKDINRMLNELLK